MEMLPDFTVPEDKGPSANKSKGLFIYAEQFDSTAIARSPRGKYGWQNEGIWHESDGTRDDTCAWSAALWMAVLHGLDLPPFLVPGAMKVLSVACCR
jgi:hypothetical protein